MIATKANPIGIDARIDFLQKQFYSSLVKKWGINASKYNCYARCYRNQTDGNNWAAEVFDGKDYTEVYFNDSVSVVSFFGLGNESPISQEGVMTANVHILFFVNLKEIKPGLERNDEEARIDVQKIIDSIGAAHGWLITKQTIGIDKILNEYPGTRKSEGLKFRDQHPLHCFRFDTQVFYEPTIC
jgi:hypothetical protein